MEWSVVFAWLVFLGTARAIVIDTSFNVTIDPNVNPWDLSICDSGQAFGCGDPQYDCQIIGSPPQQYAMTWGTSGTCTGSSGIKYVPPSPSTQTINPGDLVPIGNFYSRNVPSNCATSTARATINIDIDFALYPSQSVQLIIDIAIDETSNTPPCPYPGTPDCSDAHTYTISSPTSPVPLNNNSTLEFTFDGGSLSTQIIVNEQPSCPTDGPYYAFTISVPMSITAECNVDGCPTCTVCNDTTGACDDASITIDSVDTTFDYNTCTPNGTYDITINSSGGVAPFVYSIDNGTTTQMSNVFSGLTSGTYALFANGSYGCYGELEYTIPDCRLYNGSLSISSGTAQCTGAVTTNTTLHYVLLIDGQPTHIIGNEEDISLQLNITSPSGATFGGGWSIAPALGTNFFPASGILTIMDFGETDYYVVMLEVVLPLAYGGNVDVQACFQSFPDIVPIFVGATPCIYTSQNVVDGYIMTKTATPDTISSVNQTVEFDIVMQIDPPNDPQSGVDMTDAIPFGMSCSSSVPCYTATPVVYVEPFATLPSSLPNDYVYNTGSWPLYSFGEYNELVDFDSGYVRVQIDGGFGVALYLRGPGAQRSLRVGPVSLLYHAIASATLSFRYRKNSFGTYSLVTYISTVADATSWTTIDTINPGGGPGGSYTTRNINILPYLTPSDVVFFRIQTEITDSIYFLSDLTLTVTYNELWTTPCPLGPYYALACVAKTEYVGESFDTWSDNALYGYGNFDNPWDEVNENNGFDSGDIQIRSFAGTYSLGFDPTGTEGVTTTQSIGPPTPGAYLLSRDISFRYRRSFCSGFLRLYYQIGATTYQAGQVSCGGASDGSWQFISFDIRDNTEGATTMDIDILMESNNGNRIYLKDLLMTTVWGVQDYVLPDAPISLSNQMLCPGIANVVHATCTVDSVSNGTITNCAEMAANDNVCACTTLDVQICNPNCDCEFLMFGEDPVTCPSDCSYCNDNGICANTETPATCGSDCTMACNMDNICDPPENYKDCPTDCACDCNDNGLCELLENTPCSDCLAQPCVANGYCDVDENFSNCPEDCLPCVDNDICEVFEREWCNDCVSVGGCNNDTICDVDESIVLCTFQGTCDCLERACNNNGACEYHEDEYCADCDDTRCTPDGKCSPTENLHNCPEDCMACTPTADGMCQSGEMEECTDCHVCP